MSSLGDQSPAPATLCAAWVHPLVCILGRASLRVHRAPLPGESVQGARCSELQLLLLVPQLLVLTQLSKYFGPVKFHNNWSRTPSPTVGLGVSDLCCCSDLDAFEVSATSTPVSSGQRLGSLSSKAPSVQVYVTNKPNLYVSYHIPSQYLPECWAILNILKQICYSELNIHIN